MFSTVILASTSCQMHATNIRWLQTGVVRQASPFIKAQKKIDPEIAKLREQRKRKKLLREIKLLEQFGKKSKPIEEFSLDKKFAHNLQERLRPPVQLSEQEKDERYVIARDYAKHLNRLAILDTHWIQESIRKQEKALKILREYSPELYASAVQPDDHFVNGAVFNGPSLTPPLERYEPPDGHYNDVSKKW